MTASIQSMTGASSSNGCAWSQIDWQQAQAEVRRQQMRIAKAVRECLGLLGHVNGFSKGLSRVRENSHARFLGLGVIYCLISGTAANWRWRDDSHWAHHRQPGTDASTGMG